jgi:hypothetical protein
MRMRREVHCGTLKLEFCGAGFARVVAVLRIRRTSTEIRDAVRRTRKWAEGDFTDFLLREQMLRLFVKVMKKAGRIISFWSMRY